MAGASAARSAPLLPGGWVGVLLRIAAFGVLLLGFGMAFGVAWQTLPLPTGGAWLFAGTAVTAAAALLAGVVLIRLADGRPAAALGIGVSKETVAHVGYGTAIGGAALCVAVAGMLLAGGLHFESRPGGAGAWLAAATGQAAVFAAAALAEEAIFRGYPFQVLARAAGPIIATAVSAVLFAAAHGANPDVGLFALVNIFLAGVLLAVAYLKTLSLWFATVLHMAWNWTMATLFDLPVSGIRLLDTPGYDAVVGGPEWWTGGAFGPEGGLVGTVGFGVALLLVLKLRGVRPDPAIAAAGPLVLDAGHGPGLEGIEQGNRQ